MFIDFPLVAMGGYLSSLTLTIRVFMCRQIPNSEGTLSIRSQTAIPLMRITGNGAILLDRDQVSELPRHPLVVSGERDAPCVHSWTALRRMIYPFGLIAAYGPGCTHTTPRPT